MARKMKNPAAMPARRGSGISADKRPEDSQARPAPQAPKVLNKKHHGLPKDAVYIGRGTPWGNPFKIGRDGDRDHVCDRFECEILPALDVSTLRGKDLVCHCAPARCHGDAILRKANAPSERVTP